MAVGASIDRFGHRHFPDELVDLRPLGETTKNAESPVPAPHLLNQDPMGRLESGMQSACKSRSQRDFLEP